MSSNNSKCNRSFLSQIVKAFDISWGYVRDLARLRTSMDGVDIVIHYTSTCKIPGDFLNDGNYHVQVQVEDEIKTYFEKDLCYFTVNDSKDPKGARGSTVVIQDSHGNWPSSVVRPKLKWDEKYISFKNN